jgi:hypothetical protein
MKKMGAHDHVWQPDRHTKCVRPDFASLHVGLGGALLPVYVYCLLPNGLLINALIVLPCLLSLGRNSVRIKLELRRAELQRRDAALAIAHAPGAKIGRNDPCPCGSGRKFKQCCGGTQKYAKFVHSGYVSCPFAGGASATSGSRRGEAGEVLEVRLRTG